MLRKISVITISLMSCLFCHAQALHDSIPVDTVLLDDGSLYMGQIADSLFNGQGMCIYPDGTVYQGSWKNGLWDGQGTLVYPDGDIYKGSFHNHKKEGTGTYIYNTGASYDGDWKDDVFNGQGKLLYEDGGVYQGTWKDDMKHGYGQLTTAGKRSYTGYFYNDEYLGWPFDTRIRRDSTLTDELKEWGFEQEPYIPPGPDVSMGLSYGFRSMLTYTIWIEFQNNFIYGFSLGANISPPVEGIHSGLGRTNMPKDIHLTGTYVSTQLLMDAGYRFRRMTFGAAAGFGIVRWYQNCKANTDSGQYFGSYNLKYGDAYYRTGYDGYKITYRGYMRYSIPINDKPKAHLYLGFGNDEKLFFGLGWAL